MNKTLIVYLDAEKKAFHKITPSPNFEGYDDYGNLVLTKWRRLAEFITNSDPDRKIINYHSINII